MKFKSKLQYTSRRGKLAFVWDKYQSILTGKILDVGSDENHLKNYLPSNVSYWGIGLGGNPDQVVDLSEGQIPFEDRSYNCVLCLDVLEHLENAHQIFDELCRVSDKYVIISLPNSWRSLMLATLFGQNEEVRPLKYYGMPVNAEIDRHRWFLSYDEAAEFVKGRAKLNGYKVIQIDDHNALKGWKYFAIRCWLMLFLLFDRTKVDRFMKGTMWAVIEKDSS
ncbi:MAG: methyltransferase domain-containing protein [Chloroflexota bacterium]